MGPADLLGRIWDAAPPSIDSHVYLQLIAGCIVHGGRRTCVGEIAAYIPDDAVDQLPPLTKVPRVEAVLSIDQHTRPDGLTKDDDGSWSLDWTSDGTDVLLGSMARELRDCAPDTFSCSAEESVRFAKDVADATRRLVETGDVAEVEALFFGDGSSPQEAQEQAAGRAGTHPEDGQTGTGTTGAADPQRTPRGIGVKFPVSGGLFATPPKPPLSGYLGRFEVDIESIWPRMPRGNPRTLRGNSGQLPRSLEDISIEKERQLLQRTPRGSFYRKAFSEEAYDEISNWRPVVEEAEPLAAMLQLILTSDLRDDEADIEQPCTGIPLWHELICNAFGFTSRQHARGEMGVNTGQLIGLYRKHMDSDFHVSRCHPGKGRARILLAHSIPSSIIKTVEETMFRADPDKDLRLIGGERVKARGNYDTQLYKDRVKDVEEKDPEIPLPDYVQEMQTYLNDYRTEDFSNGQWGFLMNLEKGFDVAHKISNAKRRRQMIRRLSIIEDHPMPLYLGCDFFPRLAAEKYNQLMNMPSKVLRAMYVSGRDVEQDLSKAHLACTAPLAERNGIEASVLREYLNRGLEEEYDLWMDIASHFDVDDMEAGRKVAKNLYGTPYGSSEKNVLRNFCFDYAGATGVQHGFDPFEGAMDHPLVGELFRIREELKTVIEDRGYLVDAAGRKIRPEMFVNKDEGDAWKSVLAYTNASFEQKLMWPVFREAIEAKEWASEKSHRRPKFRIWLYQADGVTIRIGSKANNDKQIQRLQDAVAEEAGRLDIPTKLEVDFSGPPT